MLASSLITAVRRRIDDSAVPTDAQILSDLNEARYILANEYRCIHNTYTRSSIITSPKFTLGTDVIDVSKIVFTDGDNRYELVPLTETDWRALSLDVTETILDSYWKKGRDIYLSPRLSQAAHATALYGNISDVDTTAVVDDADNWSTVGSFICGTEVIGYVGKTYSSTTTRWTLSNLTRGLEGTTAAAHLDDAVCTERDIIIDYYQQPTAMTISAPDSTVEPVFSLCNNALVLVYYACWVAKQQDLDDVQTTGANGQAEYYRQLYEVEKVKFANYVTSNTYNSRDRYNTIREVCG